MIVRTAVSHDASEMSAILVEILNNWQSDRRGETAYVLAHYIEDPERIKCSVAQEDDGSILGFQSLKLATENNIYAVKPGWGIIGTYVRLGIGRRGIGTTLFKSSLDAAKVAKIPFIDATIGKTNPTALNYYESMGFRTYRETNTALGKCCDVNAVR